MKFKVTTNGGQPLIRNVSLETAQATVLANRTIPTYVRSNGDTQQGWVFEHAGHGVILFTWHGTPASDELTEQYCPWMLTLRRAVERVNPSPSKEPSND